MRSLAAGMRDARGRRGWGLHGSACALHQGLVFSCIARHVSSIALHHDGLYPRSRPRVLPALSPIPARVGRVFPVWVVGARRRRRGSARWSCPGGRGHGATRRASETKERARHPSTLALHCYHMPRSATSSSPPAGLKPAYRAVPAGALPRSSPYRPRSRVVS